MHTSAVTQHPALIRCANPGVNLCHLTAVEQGSALESIATATSCSVVVRFSAVRALAITVSNTTTSTIERLRRTIAVGAFFTIVACVAIAVVVSRQLTGWTLTIGLGRAAQYAAFVVHFHVADRWAVGTAEIVVTSGSAAHTAVISMTQTTVCVASHIAAVSGYKVVTSTPGGTITATAVLVVTVLTIRMLVVVGQREQEVIAVSGISA